MTRARTYHFGARLYREEIRLLKRYAVALGRAHNATDALRKILHDYEPQIEAEIEKATTAELQRRLRS